MPFISDDAFISLRYSERLIHGNGLTWTDGERVEGYTNFLWVIGCAILGLVRIDLINAARLLGLGSGFAAIASFAWAYRKRPSGSVPLAAGAFTLATSGTLAIWAIGGLEQCLLAALLAWSIAILWTVIDSPEESPKNLWITLGIMMGLCWWTRPDAALVCVLMLCSTLLAHRLRKAVFRRVLLSGSILFGMGALLLAFRLAYYHAWIPNSASAKLAWTHERITSGLEYVKRGIESHSALLAFVLIALFAAVFSKPARKRVLVLIPSLLAWLLYVTAIGGDIFPARRHFAIVVVLLAYSVAEALSWLRESKFKVVRLVSPLGAAVAIFVFFLVQLQDVENLRADRERWEWDGKPIGEFLHRHFASQRPLLAVDCAGNLPYFAKLPSIDMLGLNDRYLATHPPADMGKGLIGHELGNGAYLLSRKPDLVVFHLPDGGPNPEFRSGREMVANPAFYSDYVLIPFEASGPPRFLSGIWVRRDSSRIGIKRDDSLITIPGYLMAGDSVATDDSEGQLGTIITLQHEARATNVEVAAGKWRLQIESSGMQLSSTVSFGNYARNGYPNLDFELSSATSINVEVKAVGAGMGHLRTVVLQRL
jgi:hypothetical protein